MAMKEFAMDLFRGYCKENNNANERFTATEDQLLQFWRPAKQEYLYKLMGEELILSKPVSFSRPDDLLERNMSDFIHDYDNFICDFRDAVVRALGYTSYWNMDDNSEEAHFFNAFYSSLSAYGLIEGRANSEWPTVMLDGTLIHVAAGQKLMRAYHKIATAVGMEDRFEEFRIAHSQVLNQKTIKGNLHLSIHPLDYATASDNENGWSSCMSWQDSGCYRLGTVEMMNSPCVICAYLASDQATMKIADINGVEHDWPSKKWRAWIIVTKEGILCNRNYPYQCDELIKTCINWVADLAKANLGWDYLSEFNSIATWYDKKNYNFVFETNYMYNDTNDSMLMRVGSDLRAKTYRINYSGIANCMNCGCEIEYEEGEEAGTLCCHNCDGGHICECCGRWVYNDDNWYTGPNGEVLCEDCYNDNIVHCECCNDDVYAEKTRRIMVPYDRKFAEAWCLQNGINPMHPCSIDMTVCYDCLGSVGLVPYDKNLTIRGSFPFGGSEWNNGRTYMDYDWLNPQMVSAEQFVKLVNPWSKDAIELAKALWNHYSDYVENHAEDYDLN